MFSRLATLRACFQASWRESWAAHTSAKTTTTHFSNFQILNATSGFWQLYVCAGLRAIQRLIIQHVFTVARVEICEVLDLHTWATHLRSVVWPWLNYGLWKVLFCVESSFDTAQHHKTRSCSCQGRNMQSLRFPHSCFTSMKRRLALVKIWIMKSVCFCWSSFDTSYHHKTRSGGRQGWNMPSLRFTHFFLTLNVLQIHR